MQPDSAGETKGNNNSSIAKEESFVPTAEGNSGSSNLKMPSSIASNLPSAEDAEVIHNNQGNGTPSNLVIEERTGNSSISSHEEDGLNNEGTSLRASEEEESKNSDNNTVNRGNNLNTQQQQNINIGSNTANRLEQNNNTNMNIGSSTAANRVEQNINTGATANRVTGVEEQGGGDVFFGAHPYGRQTYSDDGHEALDDLSDYTVATSSSVSEELDDYLYGDNIIDSDEEEEENYSELEEDLEEGVQKTTSSSSSNEQPRKNNKIHRRDDLNKTYYSNDINNHMSSCDKEDQEMNSSSSKTAGYMAKSGSRAVTSNRKDDEKGELIYTKKKTKNSTLRIRNRMKNRIQAAKDKKAQSLELANSGGGLISNLEKSEEEASKNNTKKQGTIIINENLSSSSSSPASGSNTLLKDLTPGTASSRSKNHNNEERLVSRRSNNHRLNNNKKNITNHNSAKMVITAEEEPTSTILSQSHGVARGGGRSQIESLENSVTGIIRGGSNKLDSYDGMLLDEAPPGLLCRRSYNSLEDMIENMNSRNFLVSNRLDNKLVTATTSKKVKMGLSESGWEDAYNVDKKLNRNVGRNVGKRRPLAASRNITAKASEPDFGEVDRVLMMRQYLDLDLAKDHMYNRHNRGDNHPHLNNMRKRDKHQHLINLDHSNKRDLIRQNRVAGDLLIGTRKRSKSKHKHHSNAQAKSSSPRRRRSPSGGKKLKDHIHSHHKEDLRVGKIDDNNNCKKELLSMKGEDDSRSRHESDDDSGSSTSSSNDSLRRNSSSDDDSDDNIENDRGDFLSDDGEQDGRNLLPVDVEKGGTPNDPPVDNTTKGIKKSKKDTKRDLNKNTEKNVFVLSEKSLMLFEERNSASHHQIIPTTQRRNKHNSGNKKSKHQLGQRMRQLALDRSGHHNNYENHVDEGNAAQNYQSRTIQKLNKDHHHMHKHHQVGERAVHHDEQEEGILGHSWTDPTWSKHIEQTAAENALRFADTMRNEKIDEAIVVINELPQNIERIMKKGLETTITKLEAKEGTTKEEIEIVKQEVTEIYKDIKKGIENLEWNKGKVANIGTEVKEKRLKRDQHFLAAGAIPSNLAGAGGELNNSNLNTSYNAASSSTLTGNASGTSQHQTGLSHAVPTGAEMLKKAKDRVDEEQLQAGIVAQIVNTQKTTTGGIIDQTTVAESTDHSSKKQQANHVTSAKLVESVDNSKTEISSSDKQVDNFKTSSTGSTQHPQRKLTTTSSESSTQHSAAVGEPTEGLSSRDINLNKLDPSSLNNVDRASESNNLGTSAHEPVLECATSNLVEPSDNLDSATSKITVASTATDTSNINAKSSSAPGGVNTTGATTTVATTLVDKSMEEQEVLLDNDIAELQRAPANNYTWSQGWNDEHLELLTEMRLIPRYLSQVLEQASDKMLESRKKKQEDNNNSNIANMNSDEQIVETGDETSKSDSENISTARISQSNADPSQSNATKKLVSDPSNFNDQETEIRSDNSNVLAESSEPQDAATIKSSSEEGQSSSSSGVTNNSAQISGSSTYSAAGKKKSRGSCFSASRSNLGILETIPEEELFTVSEVVLKEASQQIDMACATIREIPTHVQNSAMMNAFVQAKIVKEHANQKVRLKEKTKRLHMLHKKEDQLNKLMQQQQQLNINMTQQNDTNNTSSNKQQLLQEQREQNKHNIIHDSSNEREDTVTNNEGSNNVMEDKYYREESNDEDSELEDEHNTSDQEDYDEGSELADEEDEDQMKKSITKTRNHRQTHELDNSSIDDDGTARSKNSITNSSGILKSKMKKRNRQLRDMVGTIPQSVLRRQMEDDNATIASSEYSTGSNQDCTFPIKNVGNLSHF